MNQSTMEEGQSCPGPWTAREPSFFFNSCLYHLLLCTQTRPGPQCQAFLPNLILKHQLLSWGLRALVPPSLAVSFTWSALSFLGEGNRTHSTWDSLSVGFCFLSPS